MKRLEDDPRYLALPSEERKKVKLRMGFPIFDESNLEKVNDMRRAKSQVGVDVHIVPTPTKGEVLFVSASDMHNEPATCYNCHFYNYEKSCMIIGPNVPIRKFTVGSVDYWPCCTMQDYGKPNKGTPTFSAHNDPSALELSWINAPEQGQKIGGANCGGANGGDDCDHYFPYGTEDKRKSKTGFCRVLQVDVGVGDVCGAWRDDDLLSYQDAMGWLRRGVPPPPKGKR